ncbi:ethanolamine ammonia-lyase light chain EutC [Neobacillus sp. OS1-32]
MVISNIHEGGLAPVEAGAYLAGLIQTILEQKASGINLNKYYKFQ